MKSWMPENHPLDLHTVEGGKLSDHGRALSIFADELNEHQPVGRAERFVDVVQSEPRFDIAAELRQNALNRRHVLDSVGNVDAQDHVIVAGRFARRGIHRLIAAHQQSLARPDHLDSVSAFGANENLT
jgi:hypothetical protein